MIDRRNFLAAIAALPTLATAQVRNVRIGWLVYGGEPLGAIDQTLVDALGERGFVADRNLELIFEYAHGLPARLQELAGSLVARKPDLLIGIGGDLVAALTNASQGRIPIVGGVSDNPIRTGLAKTIAQPGKNFTGIAYLTDELAGKRIEYLTELMPAAKRVAAIWNPQHLEDEFILAKRAAESLGITLTSHEASSLDQLDVALRSAADTDPDCLFVIPSRLISVALGKIAPFAQARNWPSVTAWREMVDGGCVLSYGPSRRFEARRVADLAIKVLNGAKPGDIPIEQPVKFELVINLKVAKAIGLHVSELLLLRADDIIE